MKINVRWKDKKNESTLHPVSQPKITWAEIDHSHERFLTCFIGGYGWIEEKGKGVPGDLKLFTNLLKAKQAIDVELGAH